MAKKDIAYVIVILVILGVMTFGFFEPTGSVTADREKSVNTAVDIYQTLSDGNVTVVSVEEQSGIYHIVLRVRGAGTDALQDVYVTRDGRFITNNIIETESYQAQLQNEKQFAQCLEENNVVIFGSSNDPNTAAQLQALGQFSGRLFFDCAQNTEQCQQIGITQVPTVVVGQQSEAGPLPASFFEQATGCSLNA